MPQSTPPKAGRRLPRLPRPPRPVALGLTPLQVDRSIAALGLLGGLLLIVLGAYDQTHARSPWLVVVPLLVVSALELWRRSHPVVTVVLGTLAVVANLPGSLVVTLLLYTDLVYAAALYGSRRFAAILHLAGVGMTVLAAVIAVARTPASVAVLLIIIAGAVFLGPVWTADLVRKHREAAETERLRADQTALLAELDRREAVTAERARMARELHDVVANHLSAIAIHTTGSLSIAKRRTDIRQDDPLLQALGVIRENSVQGLAEMRRMIGLLRSATDDGAQSQLSAAPRLAGLDVLVEQAQAAAGDRLRLRLDEEGARGGLTVPVELAAYRIVQEALTNALKHAAPGEVTVRLVYGSRATEVTVRSPYRPEAGQGLPGARAGLVGMAERASLLGGSLAAGPDSEEAGVWRVRAVLPPDTAETGERT